MPMKVSLMAKCEIKLFDTSPNGDLIETVFKATAFNTSPIPATISNTIFEPRREKTGLRGFRPGLTQTRLYSHRRWLEA